MQLHVPHANHYGTFMMPAWGRITWLLLVLLAAFPAAAGEAKNKAGECIANICLGTSITEKDIVTRYGPGRARLPRPGSGDKSSKRCYYDAAQDLFIEFEFDKHHQLQDAHHSDLDRIMVSSVPICGKNYKPKHPFPEFTTEYGLTIGTTEAALRAAMGEPDLLIAGKARSDKIPNAPREAQLESYEAMDYGETELLYDPDAQHSLLFNNFYISGGKVKSILLSNSE